MPQPLSDIGDRIELLKMTLGLFAPSEPLPIANELVGLAEEIFEHWLIDRGETAAGDTPQEGRLLALHRAAVHGESAFAVLAKPCADLLRLRALIAAEPEHPDVVERLVMAAGATGDLYAAITARMKGDGSSAPQAAPR